MRVRKSRENVESQATRKDWWYKPAGRQRWRYHLPVVSLALANMFDATTAIFVTSEEDARQTSVRWTLVDLKRLAHIPSCEFFIRLDLYAAVRLMYLRQLSALCCLSYVTG